MKIYMKEGVVSRSQTVRGWLRETSRCDVVYPCSIYYNLSSESLARETTFDNYGSDIRFMFSILMAKYCKVAIIYTLGI